MNYQIFIHIQDKKPTQKDLLPVSQKVQKDLLSWFSKTEIEKRNPSSLIKKTLDYSKK